MGHRFAVLCLTVVLASAAVWAEASDSEWLIYLRAADEYGSRSLTSYCTYGVRSGALDGYDKHDGASPPHSPCSPAWPACWVQGDGGSLVGRVVTNLAGLGPVMPHAGLSWHVWEAAIVAQSCYNTSKQRSRALMAGLHEEDTR